jgi:hypothetical protein
MNINTFWAMVADGVYIGGGVIVLILIIILVLILLRRV